MPAAMTGTRRCCSAPPNTLPQTRNFEGTVHLIFQPAEEGGGGGRVMVEQGLFDKFPCDAVFALHNKPGIPVGQIAAKAGPLLAASDRWDIRIKGHGTHAAHPHLGIDPFVIGAEIVLALQTIVSRTIDPLDFGGRQHRFHPRRSAYNAIPDGLHIGGTARSFRPEVQDSIERRIGEIARGQRSCTAPRPRRAIAAAIRRRSITRPRPNSPPRSRPRSAARTGCSATSRRRWAARISRTC